MVNRSTSQLYRSLMTDREREALRWHNQTFTKPAAYIFTDSPNPSPFDIVRFHFEYADGSIKWDYECSYSAGHIANILRGRSPYWTPGA